ncbi:MAG: hypothetical protein A2X94_12570 [Bdellovibrionales bacterium GWB1_55_8]|nr:MAG: hypothetical protein A2X94_12570 [Bdellovibrionales bacterium GWB1_55_8]
MESQHSQKSRSTKIETQFFSAWKTFLQVLTTVISVEMLIMTFYHFGPFELSWWAEALIDAGLIAVAIFVSTWCLHLRPLRQAVRQERQNAERMSHQATIAIEEQRLALIEATKLSALGELAADTAHEINNPVAAIRLTAEQLSELIDEQHPQSSDISDMAKTIAEQAARVGRIIDGLRHLARGGATAPLQSIGLHYLLNSALRLHDDLFPNRSAEVSIQLDLGTQPESTLECRPIQIEQVLLNLVNNAYDAIQGLENKWIKIAAHESENAIEVSVTDSGSISSEIRDQLFRPRFTTKPPGKGNGLGLGICKRIIESHKGKLSLDVLSENTRFVIRFPKSLVSSPAGNKG